MGEKLYTKDISSEDSVDESFIKLTEDFKRYSENLKVKFDDFDKKNPNKEDRISFLEKKKDSIFKKFDHHFNKVWDAVRLLDKDRYKIYKKYYITELYGLYGKQIELNRHVYTKPLGYAGDYVAMNYTYDYNNQTKRYLGDTSFQKLINCYTSITPIWSSNIIRKDLLKSKIMETIKDVGAADVASIGSGSARELLELLKENKITKHINFMCLDFEKKAIDYVKREINKIENQSKKNLNIEYIHKNIVELIKGKGIDKQFDFIYISGVFDYLSDKLCARVTSKMFDLLNKNGSLMICNASAEKAIHRGYYEFLGDWVMVYRTKAEMLAWAKNIQNISEVKFEDPNPFSKYWFLNIKKLR